jgi:hypothetical protein
VRWTLAKTPSLSSTRRTPHREVHLRRPTTCLTHLRPQNHLTRALRCTTRHAPALAPRSAAPHHRPAHTEPAPQPGVRHAARTRMRSRRSQATIPASPLPGHPDRAPLRRVLPPPVLPGVGCLFPVTPTGLHCGYIGWWPDSRARLFPDTTAGLHCGRPAQRIRGGQRRSLFPVTTIGHHRGAPVISTPR